jgi:hypothetical protein
MRLAAAALRWREAARAVGQIRHALGALIRACVCDDVQSSIF